MCVCVCVFIQGKNKAGAGNADIVLNCLLCSGDIFFGFLSKTPEFADTVLFPSSESFNRYGTGAYVRRVNV